MFCPILGHPASSRFLKLVMGTDGHPSLISQNCLSWFRFLTYYFPKCRFPHASCNRLHGCFDHMERLNIFQNITLTPKGCVCV